MWPSQTWPRAQVRATSLALSILLSLALNARAAGTSEEPSAPVAPEQPGAWRPGLAPVGDSVAPSPSAPSDGSNLSAHAGWICILASLGVGGIGGGMVALAVSDVPLPASGETALALIGVLDVFIGLLGVMVGVVMATVGAVASSLPVPTPKAKATSGVRISLGPAAWGTSPDHVAPGLRLALQF